MMFATCPHSRLQRLAVALTLVLGLVSIAAGGRILLGIGTAGYQVVRPVLLFNTVMGAVYVALAVLISRSAERGWVGLAAVALLNLGVLGGLLAFVATGGEVARETLGAMTFRTAYLAAVFGLVAVVVRRGKQLIR